jgi:ribose transport system substrate-binding protein
MKKLARITCMLMALAIITTALPASAAAPRRYYFVGAVLGHPYMIDMRLGIQYAQEKLGVEVVTVGPQAWDMVAQAEALEQTIARRPAGIVIPVWDATVVPGIKRAMKAGIPVVTVETTVPGSGAMSYVGLDNYDAGVVAADELLARGGKSGKVGIVMNAGAANTELKKQGLLDKLEGTGWKVVSYAESEGDPTKAAESSKAMFKAHPEITAAVALDSGGSTGLALAVEELRLQSKNLIIIGSDREDITLEYVDKGVMTATVVAKTALMPYFALEMLEDYNNRRNNDVPISANNAKARVNSVPEFCYVGAVVVDKTNVKFFLRDNMPKLAK